MFVQRVSVTVKHVELLALPPSVLLAENHIFLLGDGR